MHHHKMIHHILRHADVKLLFTGKLDNWDVQKQAVPENVTIVNYPYDKKIIADFHWDEIMKSYEPDPENYLPEADDVFSIIYTSGTGGLPSGVVITFGNQSAMTRAVLEALEKLFSINKEMRYLSFLPLGHIYERAFAVSGPSLKIKFYMLESLEKFPDNMRDVAPDVFSGVPRLWKVFKEKILEKVPQKKLDIILKIPILSGLIKRKIQRSLGLQNALCLTGSAKVAPTIIEWFEKLGIILYEGYGATETLALTVVNYPGHRKVGTIGLPLPGYEYKLGEENELLCRSKAVMKEYYKDPEKTSMVLDDDGYYHTGDLASIDDDGYITILGRKNDTFKTDKGEFVIPAPIENRFYEIHELSQVCMIGQNLPQPVMVVHLSDDAKNLDRKILRHKIGLELKKINNDLAKYEKLTHILITSDDWTIENELLTPTFKIKRNSVAEKWMHVISKLKDFDNGVYWEDEL